MMKNRADINYYAGQHQFYSGDSRSDIYEFIRWAKEFEQINLFTDWDAADYILAIEEFAKDKLSAPV